MAELRKDDSPLVVTPSSVKIGCMVPENDKVLPTSDASVSPPSTGRWPPATGNLPPWSTRRLLLTAAALALLAALATLLDFPIARWARDTDLPSDLARLVRLAEVFGFGGTAAVIIITAGVLDPRGWRVVMLLTVCVFGPGLVANSVKLMIARQRPSAAPIDEASALGTFAGWLPAVYRDDLPVKYGHALQSFPSGHAATATGLALGLAMLYPRGRWLFAAFAALACFQRVDAGAHFLSDVFAGAAIGCAVAALVRRLRKE